MELRPDMDNKQRIVVKIGSALLTDGGRLIDSAAISQWVAQIAGLMHAGREVILVSSGAVAAGMSQLGWAERPTRINELQAAAAVGQMGLVRIYQDLFSEFQLTTAQILLDHDDLSSRQRYINARSALTTLLDFNVLPVVNENDTVATDEIRFGDNDSLAAMVANLVDADLLVILTDQDGMYTADPRSNPDAELLSEVSAGDRRLDAMASGGGTLGRGGMVTKVKAARLAARSGTDTIVVGGKLPSVITRISAGEPLGTWLRADQQPQQARKQWLAGLMQVRGQLVLDTGAVTVLKTRGSSLLAVGVLASTGNYQRGDLVECVSEQGAVIARGLCNYSGREVEQISGQPTEQIASILGYKDEDELIHRDNMVVL